jgi:hypothetical protein
MRTCDVVTEFQLEFISLSLLILSILNLIRSMWGAIFCPF